MCIILCILLTFSYISARNLWCEDIKSYFLYPCILKTIWNKEKCHIFVVLLRFKLSPSLHNFLHDLANFNLFVEKPIPGKWCRRPVHNSEMNNAHLNSVNWNHWLVLRTTAYTIRQAFYTLLLTSFEIFCWTGSW